MSERTTQKPQEFSPHILSEELEWFFGYAARGLRHQRVAMLPSRVAERTRASDARRKAERLGVEVQECLFALPNPHPVVLRAVFTPRRWPRAVQNAFKHLAPIAVRLFFSSDPWPGRLSHMGLEDAAALQLAGRLGGRDLGHAEALRSQAERLFDSAMVEYGTRRSAATRALRGRR